MFCRYCGRQIEDSSLFCTYCGKKLYTASADQHGTNTTEQKDTMQYKHDENSIGLNVISFFVPIAGLIMYCVFENKYPVRSHGCGKWALIGFLVGIIALAIGWACINAMIMGYCI